MAGGTTPIRNLGDIARQIASAHRACMLKLPHKRRDGTARTRPALLTSLLVALLLTLAGPGNALAVGTPDQGIGPDWFAYSAPFTMSQTFTAGITGQLDTVALFGSNGTWNVAIRDAAGGAPTGPYLATGSAPANGGWSQISLTPAIDITAGTMYAIVVAGTTPFWNAGAGDYPGGTGFFADEAFVLDFAFQTYVTPPPPPPPPPLPPEPPILDLIVTNAVGAAEAGPFSGSVTTAVGTTVWRRVTVTNGSNVSLGGITVSDTAGALPASCPELPSWLAIGESWTCTFGGNAAAGTTSYVTVGKGERHLRKRGLWRRPGHDHRHRAPLEPRPPGRSAPSSGLRRTPVPTPRPRRSPGSTGT